jgi:hypothetical protein
MDKKMKWVRCYAVQFGNSIFYPTERKGVRCYFKRKFAVEKIKRVGKGKIVPVELLIAPLRRK